VEVIVDGDVSADPRYLTAFGTTPSEIIVPVFDRDDRRRERRTECIQQGYSGSSAELLRCDSTPLGL
jgi:hypothetical protein